MSKNLLPAFDALESLAEDAVRNHRTDDERTIRIVCRSVEKELATLRAEVERLTAERDARDRTIADYERTLRSVMMGTATTGTDWGIPTIHEECRAALDAHKKGE